MESKKIITKDTADILPKIFLFINGHNQLGYFPVALAEDGNVLAEHCSSSPGWAKHDIGFASEWKHDHYKKHYPDGFELIWLEESELESNADFNEAYRKNKLQDTLTA